MDLSKHHLAVHTHYTEQLAATERSTVPSPPLSPSFNALARTPSTSSSASASARRARLIKTTATTGSNQSSGSSAKTVSGIPCVRPSEGAPAAEPNQHGPMYPQKQHHHAQALRVSTRPSTKRASSYSPGMVLSLPQPADTALYPTSATGDTSTSSSRSASTTTPTAVAHGYSAQGNGYLPSSSASSPPGRHSHSLSVNLPLAIGDDWHASSSHLQHNAPNSRYHIPSSLRAELYGPAQTSMDSSPHASTDAIQIFDQSYPADSSNHLQNFSNIPASSPLAGTSPTLSLGSNGGILQATRANSNGFPGRRFSHPRFVQPGQDLVGTYANTSPPVMRQASYGLPSSDAGYASSLSPPRSRQTTDPDNHDNLSVPLSPSLASRLAKGKMRSRNPSLSSSNAQDHRLDAADLSTDVENLDLVSEHGGSNAPWDVKETDRLRSAKDAQGRKMINQYARVAEIGRGVHGRVWLCEDTDTREFFAIKSVNRENRKNKSLKRSQAEAAEASRRQRFAQGSNDDIYSNDYYYAENNEEVSAATNSTAPQSENDDASPPQPLPRLIEGHQRPQRDIENSFDEKMELNSPPKSSPHHAYKKRPIVMDEKVKQEIAIMKRVHHPNVVQLREVIDDRRSKKIFMVLEYMPGGQIEWTRDNEPTMTVDEARSAFRDVVLGLEYLHYQGIIHRDIKPANLLWDQDKQTVKISDFGVSHVSEALARSSAANPSGGKVGLHDDRALRKTEGSPAFFAPELCAGYESTPVGTPLGELERTQSRPEYFRQNSGKSSNAGSLSDGRGNITPSNISTIPPLTAITSMKRPLSSQRNSTASIMTISPPLSAQQQQVHRARARERPMVGKGIDVWALGVTLYCLLFGFTPFHEATTEYELYNIIPKKQITIPPLMGSDHLPTGSGVSGANTTNSDEYAEGREVVHLLSRLLEKDPSKRIQLHEVKQHPWVLRNLRDSAGWLAEHDLADTGVLHVTEEEVQHATAERAVPVIPQSSLKASFKRFADVFGLGGQNLLRRSVRRDRSKSISSTSASITTASAFDGRSEPSQSRTASRHASIVKKKPSTSRSTKSGAGGSEEMPGSSYEHHEVDTNALMTHAMALKRRLTNHKAAREAHEAALSASMPSPTGAHAPSLPSTSPHSSQSHSHAMFSHSPQMARTVSGESGRSRSETHKSSVGTHLLPPQDMLRGSSSAATSEAGSVPSSSMGFQGAAKASRPSLSSVTSRPWSNGSFVASNTQLGSDNEGKISTGIKNVWRKLRSGSRTPAAPGSPRVPNKTLSALTPAPANGDRDIEAIPAGLASSSAASRPSSTKPDVLLPPAALAAQIQAYQDGEDPRLDWEATKRAIQSEDVITDSSDDLSDDFEDDDDYGDAISPMEHDSTTQPSSLGVTQPLMWSDPENGWRATPALNADPLGQFFRQQQLQPQAVSRQSSSSILGSDIGAQVSDSTPRAVKHVMVESPSASFVQTEEREHARPPLSRDGSIHKDYSAKVPAPSPGRLSRSQIGRAGHVADDENDDGDEEEEEVMIKPRSRLRRTTNSALALGNSPTHQARAPMGYAPPVAYPGC